MAKLLGQFDTDRAAALHTLAAALARVAGRTGGRHANLGWSQAILVSADGGSPPTCTISFDDGATDLPGVRYMGGYTPTPGDVVEVRIRDGNPVVEGALAS